MEMVVWACPSYFSFESQIGLCLAIVEESEREAFIKIKKWKRKRGRGFRKGGEGKR